MPDWHFSHAIFPRMVFCCENEQCRKLRIPGPRLDHIPRDLCGVLTLRNMNAFKSEHNGQPLPNSKKTYVSGKLHPDIRVPFREISLAPTKSINGEIEINEPVRVYDTSGPWGDPDFHGDVTQGLPPLRAKWIRERGDVEEIEVGKYQPTR